jgi:predicted ATPase
VINAATQIVVVLIREIRQTAVLPVFLYKMSRIKIKHFGPIKEGCQDDDGWIEVKKVTVFVGNQGSAKSTVAKLISTLTWIEKVLVRGDFQKKWFKPKNKFKNQYLNYHRLEN